MIFGSKLKNPINFCGFGFASFANLPVEKVDNLLEAEEITDKMACIYILLTTNKYRESLHSTVLQ